MTERTGPKISSLPIVERLSTLPNIVGLDEEAAVEMRRTATAGGESGALGQSPLDEGFDIVSLAPIGERPHLDARVERIADRDLAEFGGQRLDQRVVTPDPRSRA